MATKNFMDLTNLTQYDGLIKNYIDSADADSIKSIDIDGNTVNFYKTSDGSGSAAYSVELPDTSEFMQLISNATGGKVVVSESDGSVIESSISENQLVTGYWGTSHQGEIVIYSGNGQYDISTTAIDPGNIMEKIDSASGSKIVVSDINGDVTESDYGVDDFLSTIDGAEGDKIVITESDGSISESDIDIDDVLTKISNASGDYLVVTNSDGTISESNYDPSDFVTGYWEGLADSNIVVLFDDETGTIAASSISTTDILTKIENADGDKIVISNSDGTISESDLELDDIPTLGVIDAGYFLVSDSSGELESSSISPTQIEDLTTLVGTIPLTSSATTVIGYTDEQIAAVEAKLGGVLHYKGVVATVSALPSNAQNGDVYHVTEKSAEYAYLVNSGTGAWEELGTVVDLSNYSTTAQMNTAISNAINALDATVNKTAGADGLALSVTETNGVITAVTGSIAANTYDAYGAASTVQTTLVGTSSDTGSASTIYGAKAYADSATASISSSDINALFS